MSRKLILAEKPSVARDIARVLGVNKEKNGYMESNKYIVTWALGHLVTLADPEVYGTNYKVWNIEELPIIPQKLKTVVIKKTSKQFNIVKSLMNRDDINEIVIATDAGREGELVARWIIYKSGVKKHMKRLWISSNTKKAIEYGFKSLKDGHDYDNLYYSAVARAEADWIVGINATRALTTKYNAQLSCGRVQTPTIAIVKHREDEIKNFKPKDFYGLEAVVSKLNSNIKFVWQDKCNNSYSFDREKIVSILTKLRNKKLVILDVVASTKCKYSPTLYDLTELQRDANKIYGFSAKETLNIMQKLYEQHKVLTYPRTDSRYLTEDIVETIKDRVKAVNISLYSGVCNRILRSNISVIAKNKNYVDNTKVTDHHAIIPTEERVYINDLSEKEKKIYDLVVKRFLAILSKPYKYEQTKVIAKIENENFVSSGMKVLDIGWKEIYSEKAKDLNEILILKKGDKLDVMDIIINSLKTNPPAHLNEATLLTQMEKNGLGTVATRADIIEKLFNTYLLEKKEKDIFITLKGKQLLELVPDELRSPLMTSTWENKLQEITKGKMSKKVFIEEMKSFTDKIIKEIKESDTKFKHDNITKNVCPNCGSYMLDVKGKKGKLLVCSNRECNLRKVISKITNSRCPNCHKKLELRGEGNDRIFVCSCGYKEKLSSFNKRKQQEKAIASKSDISKYLKTQNKNSEDFNNPFAKALKNLKK